MFPTLEKPGRESVLQRGKRAPYRLGHYAVSIGRIRAFLAPLWRPSGAPAKCPVFLPGRPAPPLWRPAIEPRDRPRPSGRSAPPPLRPSAPPPLRPLRPSAPPAAPPLRPLRPSAPGARQAGPCATLALRGGRWPGARQAWPCATLALRRAGIGSPPHPGAARRARAGVTAHPALRAGANTTRARETPEPALSRCGTTSCANLT